MIKPIFDLLEHEPHTHIERLREEEEEEEEEEEAKRFLFLFFGSRLILFICWWF